VLSSEARQEGSDGFAGRSTGRSVTGASNAEVGTSVRFGLFSGTVAVDFEKVVDAATSWWDDDYRRPTDEHPTSDSYESTGN
jgi:hypothetical protein